MSDSATASAILIIADWIYHDYELNKLTQEEYFKLTNIEDIIRKYTKENIDQIHAMLNSYFDY